MGNAKVHLGFLDAYNAVALDVLHIVQDQLAVHPSYRIIVTGHSLGGAIAALGAISIKSAHPHVPIKLFTFGQPRVGNPSFADYVERLIGVDNIFRGAYIVPPNGCFMLKFTLAVHTWGLYSSSPIVSWYLTVHQTVLLPSHQIF